jgi:cytochrome c biogenesis protein CcmG/thiol:disulfide interchange protein DsbE|tara:strand:- start:276 stop:797 length:522 start_codon:yes stop_codon:yes gene_type:complete
MKKILPLALFVVLAGFLYLSLDSNPSKLPSPLVGKIFPAASGTGLFSGESIKLDELFINEEFSLVNVWASWCVTCRAEHTAIMKIAKSENLQMIGINYKDVQVDAKKYLEILGNPFDVIVFDPEGKIGLELGVYATPETFLVDREGLIVYKHIGEINDQIWKENFISLINKNN